MPFGFYLTWPGTKSPSIAERGQASRTTKALATKPELTTLRAEVPSRLLAEMQSLVDAGWFQSLDEIMLDALRRFLESHREDLMEVLIREDVEWGLRGED